MGRGFLGGAATGGELAFVLVGCEELILVSTLLYQVQQKLTRS